MTANGGRPGRFEVHYYKSQFYSYIYMEIPLEYSEKSQYFTHHLVYCTFWLIPTPLLGVLGVVKVYRPYPAAFASSGCYDGIMGTC
jgi:hypothetical protein